MNSVVRLLNLPPVTKRVNYRATSGIECFGHDVVPVKGKFGSAGLPTVETVVVLEIVDTVGSEKLRILRFVVKGARIFTTGEGASAGVHSKLHT